MIKFSRRNFHKFCNKTDVGDLIFIQQKSTHSRNSASDWHVDAFKAAILLKKELIIKKDSDKSPRYLYKILVFFQDEMREETIADDSHRVILNPRQYLYYFHESKQ